MSRLIEQSELMVYTNCLRLLKDPEEARDMAQEVYLTVFLKLDTLKKPEAFFDWVKVIKVNKCKNKLKENNPYFLFEDANGPAQSLYEDKDPGDPYAHIEDKRDQVSPDKTLDTKETQELLIDLIDDLPDAQRMVLILFYYDDYTIREISRIMDISEGTVKSRLAYGRLALKKALEREKKKGSILYGRAPVAFLAYIAHFLKKNFPGHPDEALFLSIREAVLAALEESGTATGVVSTTAAGAAGTATTTAGNTLVSAADSLAVEAANAFISSGLSLKGLSLTALWATAWGKAALATVTGAVLIGSVAGGLSLTMKNRQPEFVPAQTQEVLREETTESTTESQATLPVEESIQELPESSFETPGVQENISQTSETTMTVTEPEEINSEAENTVVIPDTENETAAAQEQTTVLEEQSSQVQEQPTITEEQSISETESSEITEESSEASVTENTIEELEQELVAQQINMENTQVNYDNAVEVYEDALAMVENDMAEARIICERERNDWKESYDNQVSSNQQESGLYTEEDLAYSLSNYQKWQELYDFVFSATVEDAKNQNFPAEFANVNTWGAELVEKEEILNFWQNQLDEQQARLDAAQAALDAAK